MSDPLGLRLVRAILNDKKYPPNFKDLRPAIYEDAVESIEWIEKQTSGGKPWPTAKMVEENVGVTLDDVSEPLDYIADLIRKRGLAKDIESGMRSVIDHIEARDPDEALKTLKNFATGIKVTTKELVPLSYRGSGSERYADYVEAKSHSGLIGIKTPWPQLNHNIQGWCNGCFHVIAAMSNTGKSWVLCHIANACEVLGKKVLFVTLEMSVKRMTRRIDSIRFKIPFGKLRDCEIDKVRQDLWEKELAAMGKTTESDIILADKKLVRTVEDVVRLVNDHEPDIVLVDGGYRFDVDGRAGNWEKTVKIVNGLQVAAEITDIPWVVTTQLGDGDETGKVKKSGPHIRGWNVRYGKEWLINPDVLIGMYQDDDLRLIQEMEMHTMKVRDADEVCGVFNINWNHKTMDFNQCDIEEEEEEELVSTGVTVGKGHEVTY